MFRGWRCVFKRMDNCYENKDKDMFMGFNLERNV